MSWVVRVGPVACGLVWVLCLSGCSGDADGPAGDAASSASPSSQSPSQSPSTSPVGSDVADDEEITGGWETSYGRLTFDVAGDVFEGSYDGEFGTLAGTVDGPKVEGEWYEPATSVECDEERGGTVHWGTFTFVFADDGNSFDGTWGYCGGEQDDVWTGERKPDASPS